MSLPPRSLPPTLSDAPLPDCLASSGVPANVAAATLTATYNDLNSVRELFAANKGQIAGVILEPVVGNSGFIPPTKEFLQVIDFSQGNWARLGNSPGSLH